MRMSECGRAVVSFVLVLVSASGCAVAHSLAVSTELGGASVGFRDTSKRHGGPSATLRGSFPVRPDLSLFLAAAGWLVPFSGIEGRGGADNPSAYSTAWTLGEISMRATYSPATRGVFVRGGLGIGRANAKVVKGASLQYYSETGLVLEIAAGYARRVSSRFGVTGEVRAADFELDALGAAQVFGGDFGLSWCW